MTITTPSRIRERAPPPRGAAFTLVEIMVGATLSTFVLVAVLSSFLFLGRSTMNLRNYSDMEAESRRALEQFAEDVRQASAIAWSSGVAIQLTVNSAPVDYYYDNVAQTFCRRTGTATTVLVTGIAKGSFVFRPYNVAGVLLPLTTKDELAAAGTGTKQLQLSLETSRTQTMVRTATNLVLSARYILRNKIVTA